MLVGLDIKPRKIKRIANKTIENSLMFSIIAKKCLLYKYKSVSLPVFSI